MPTRSFGFIGGGRVVRIILDALKSQDQWPNRIFVSDPDADTVKSLVDRYPNRLIHTGSNSEAAAQDWVFLAVHPPALKSVLPEITSSLSVNTIVISLAPVFTLTKLRPMLDGHDKLVRMIPNAATMINQGYNPVCYASSISVEERKELDQFFRFLGECPLVEETTLEAYAIITAMGPTYLWPQLNELHQLGLDFGLEQKDVIKGIKFMVQGTLSTLYDSGLDYEEITDLIPVKPLDESEDSIRKIYREKLTGLYNKLKGN